MAERNWTTGVSTALIVGLLAVTLAGCAGGSRSGSDQPGGVPQPSAVSGPAGASQRTAIGTSSEPDVASVLRANEVSEPERWAQVVIAYRPYPSGAEGQDRLRQVLTRFKADPDDIAKIDNALTP